MRQKLAHLTLLLLMAALWLAFAALAAHAQYTTVSATIVDPAGTPYAGCRGTADFISQSSTAQLSLLSGSIFQKQFPLNCDSFGHFSLRAADNLILTPQPSQWRFSICAADGRTCFSSLQTVSGLSLDLSAALSSLAPPLPLGLLNTSSFISSSSFQTLLSSGTYAATFSDLHSKRSPIDVKAFGAEGSAFWGFSTCTSGSTTLTLGAGGAGDYKNGDGIHLIHCGSPVALNSPSISSTTVTGPGTSTHSYQIAALDDFGGVTAASTASTVNNAAANMDYAHYVEIRWPVPTPVAGAVPRAYAVYRDGLLMTIVGVEGWAQRWVSSRPFRANNYVQPTVWNGHYYLVTTAAQSRLGLLNGATANATAGVNTFTPLSMNGISSGARLVLDMGTSLAETITVASTTATTFTATTVKTHSWGATVDAIAGATEPTWCTSSGCTTTDGGLTLTEQDFRWVDIGNWQLATTTTWPTIPVNAPTTPLADSFVTTIASGAGTTTLHLSAAPLTSISNTYTTHDDTAALQAAYSFAASNGMGANPQWISGSSAMNVTGCFKLPHRHYVISQAWNPGDYCVLGENNTTIQQIIPSRNVIERNPGYSLILRNLYLLGGANGVYYTNGNSGGRLELDEVSFAGMWDYAVQLRGNQTSPQNDDHLSHFAHWKGGWVMGAKHLLYNTADQFLMQGVSVAFMEVLHDEQAQIFNSGGLHMTDFFASPGRQWPGQHPWIDTYGVIVDISGTGSRFGGEGNGGYPIVGVHRDYCGLIGPGTLQSGCGTGIAYNNTTVKINGGATCIGSGLPAAGVIDLVDAVPSTIIVGDNMCLGGDPIVRNLGLPGAALNLALELYDPFMRGPILPPSLQYSLGPMQRYTGPWAATPVELMPYVVNQTPQLSTSPLAGYWAANQRVRNSANPLSSNAPAAWINLRSGISAPAWAANTAYSASDIRLPSTDNGHAYMAVVPGTSDAATEPTWPTTAKALVTDGGVTWVEIGPASKWVATDVTGCTPGGMCSANMAGAPLYISMCAPEAMSDAYFNRTNYYLLDRNVTCSDVSVSAPVAPSGCTGAWPEAGAHGTTTGWKSLYLFSDTAHGTDSSSIPAGPLHFVSGEVLNVGLKTLANTCTNTGTKGACIVMKCSLDN